MNQRTVAARPSPNPTVMRIDAGQPIPRRQWPVRLQRVRIALEDRRTRLHQRGVGRRHSREVAPCRRPTRPSSPGTVGSTLCSVRRWWQWPKTPNPAA